MRWQKGQGEPIDNEPNARRNVFWRWKKGLRHPLRWMWRSKVVDNGYFDGVKGIGKTIMMFFVLTLMVPGNPHQTRNALQCWKCEGFTYHQWCVWFVSL
jgi:hypothetical protein